MRKVILKKTIVGIAFCFCLSVLVSIACGQKIVTAAQVNGTWREASSKPAGVTTEFWVWSLGGQKLQVEFFGNNAAGKFSDTATGIIAIDGTTATFQPPDNQTNSANPCVMTLKFSAAKLFVSEKGECGWGRGIGAAGTYKKVSSKKSAFDQP